MINYQPGDLVLIAFPYTAGGQAKCRPAMVVLDVGDADILVARVTTQSGQDDHDVLLRDWKDAGLLASSTVRLHKLATLEKALVQRRLGCVQTEDRAAISLAMQRVFGNW
jgi:mRNA interferase MazF